MKTPLLAILSFCSFFSFSQDTGTPISWGQGAAVDYSDMDVDADGNVFFAMQYMREFSLPELKKTIPYHNDVCSGVIKYSAEGKTLWMIGIEGVTSNVVQKSIYATKNGDFIVTGYFYGEAVFHSVSKIPKKVGQKKNKHDYDDPNFLFLARYSAKGNLIWVKTLHTLIGEGISVVENSKGNLFWEIRFTRELEDGRKTISKTDGHTMDWFKQIILKLNSDGEITGIHPFQRMIYTGSNATTTFAKLVIDKEDGLIVNGDFTKSVRFTERDSLSNDGHHEAFDAFLVKFDKDDNYVWSRKIGGQEHQIIRSLHLDEKGRIYIVGYYRSECIISQGIQLIQQSQYKFKPGECLFYCRFSQDGLLDFSYFRRTPGDSDWASISASAIVVDERGYSHIFGAFNDTLKWNGTPIVSEHHASNRASFYGRWKSDSLVSISKPLQSEKAQYWVFVQDACIKNNRIYVSGGSVGNNFINNSGGNIELSGEQFQRSAYIYSFKIPDSANSVEESPVDHLAEIEPIINCLSPSRIAEPNVWIPSQGVQPTPVLDENGDCGVNRENCSALLFPNPSEDLTTLTVKGLKGNLTIQVFSASGQFLFTQGIDIQNEEQNIELNFAGVEPGTYYVQLVQGNYKKILPLVKSH